MQRKEGSSWTLQCGRVMFLATFGQELTRRRHQELQQWWLHSKNVVGCTSPPEDFRHVVQNSQSCYAVYHSHSQGTSNPTGYCNVQKRDRQFGCTNRGCSKKSGSSKQMKLWTICPLLHILFCVLKMASDSDPVNTAPLSASDESNKDIFTFLLFSDIGLDQPPRGHWIVTFIRVF